MKASDLHAGLSVALRDYSPPETEKPDKYATGFDRKPRWRHVKVLDVLDEVRAGDCPWVLVEAVDKVTCPPKGFKVDPARPELAFHGAEEPGAGLLIATLRPGDKAWVRPIDLQPLAWAQEQAEKDAERDRIDKVLRDEGLFDSPHHKSLSHVRVAALVEEVNALRADACRVQEILEEEAADELAAVEAAARAHAAIRAVS